MLLHPPRNAGGEMMGCVSVPRFSSDHRVQFTIQQHQPVATKPWNAVCAEKQGVGVGEV